MLIRLEALELAANAASADVADRYALNCIQVLPDGAVVVTDGTYMLRIQAAVKEPGLFDALLPAEERGYEGEVLINADDARDFKAACRKALKKAGRKPVSEGGEPVHVVVARAEETLTMATADGVVERRFVIKDSADERAYPDVEKVIPQGTKREITLSVELLTKMLRTLRRLNAKAVTLGLTKDPQAAISLRATTLAGEIDGALMPMRTEDAPTVEVPANVDRKTGELVEAPAIH